MTKNDKAPFGSIWNTSDVDEFGHAAHRIPGGPILWIAPAICLGTFLLGCLGVAFWGWGA